MAAVAVGTALVSAFSSFSKGRAQKRLAEERARQKRLQALEIQRRNESEINILRDQASGAVGEAITRYAGSGIDVGSGASVQARMQSYENLGRVILNKEFETKFRVSQLNAEERWELQQGKEYQNASILEGVGTLFKTGMNLYSAAGDTSGLTTGETYTDAGFDPSAVSNVV